MDNREQIKKALKQCASGDQACENCPYESLGVENNCFDVLKSDALALINSQETAYNELYELYESYRKELGEVKANTVRKAADFVWQGEDERLNILMGEKAYSKQEFIDKLKKEI